MNFAGARGLPIAVMIQNNQIALDTFAVGHAAARGEVEVLETGPGDGTVLRSSVLLDERVGNEWQYSLKLPIE